MDLEKLRSAVEDKLTLHFWEGDGPKKIEQRRGGEEEGGKKNTFFPPKTLAGGRGWLHKEEDIERRESFSLPLNKERSGSSVLILLQLRGVPYTSPLNLAIPVVILYRQLFGDKIKEKLKSRTLFIFFDYVSHDRQDEGILEIVRHRNQSLNLQANPLHALLYNYFFFSRYISSSLVFNPELAPIAGHKTKFIIHKQRALQIP